MHPFRTNRFTKHRRARSSVVVCLLALLVATSVTHGQVSPEDHAKHHPADGGAAPMNPAAPVAPAAGGMPATGAMPAPGAAAAPAAGMGGMMDMMKGMGNGAQKDAPLYPSLMAMPELTPEKRREIEVEGNQRMTAGTAKLGAGLDMLGPALAASDFKAMQAATAQMRQGVAEFESGVASWRALAEGQPPRDVALGWFRTEMNLDTTAAREPALGGISIFHLFTMVLLVAFALAMLAMYYFKMRRAAALFGRIEPDKGSPPPGSSPPLAGGPGPSTPPRQTGPPDGKPSPPASHDKRATPNESPSDKAAAAVPSPPESQASSARRVEPLKEKWAGKLRVESVIRETPTVQTFRLRSPGDGELPFIFTPGQFLNVAFGIGGARMNRSYSISSSPTQRRYVDLTIKREERGAVSRHIIDLVAVGEEIEAGGPVGKFVFTGTEADSVVFISAGVGITPMMCAMRYLTERSWPGDIYFIYSCRTPADYIFASEIAELERRNPKLHVLVTMTKPGREWKGPRGRLTKEMLTAAVPGFASRRVHVCGPVTMMDATKAMVLELGVSPDNYKSEQFGAVKPPPPAPGTTAKPTAAATGALVTFSKNGKSAKIHTDQTILELSEELGIGIDFSCRIGTCGVCKVKMTSGEVEQEIQDALDDDDKNNGIILACQAKPTAEVTVEA